MSNEWGTGHGGEDRSPLRNVTNVSKSEDSGDGEWGKTYDDSYGGFNGPSIYTGQTDYATHTDDCVDQAGSASQRDNPAHQHHAPGLRGECHGCRQLGHNEADFPEWSRAAACGGGSGVGCGGCYKCGGAGHNKDDCPETCANSRECYKCGQTGHNKANCPNERFERAFAGTCNLSAHVDSRAADFPAAPPNLCKNCGEKGYVAFRCTNQRKLDCEPIDPDQAEKGWALLVKASEEEDFDDGEEGFRLYTAARPDVTYQELETSFRENKMNLYLIALEKKLELTVTIVDLQGNIDKRYVASICFQAHLRGPMEEAMCPASPEVNFERLADAGKVMPRGVPLYESCGEEGPWSKDCSNESATKCHSCDGPHMATDWTEPKVYSRVQCRNCNQKRHNVARCQESQFGSGHASFGGIDYGGDNYHDNIFHSGTQAEDKHRNYKLFSSDTKGAAQPENRWNSGPAESHNGWATRETRYDHSAISKVGNSYSRASENGGWESRGNNMVPVGQTNWEKTPKAAPLTPVLHVGLAMSHGDVVKTGALSPVKGTKADTAYAVWNRQTSQPVTGARKDFDTPPHDTGNRYSSRLAPNRLASSEKTSGSNCRDLWTPKPYLTLSAGPYTSAAHDRFAIWNNGDTLGTAAVCNEAKTKTCGRGYQSRPAPSRHAESRKGTTRSRKVITPRPSITPSATSYTAPSTYEHSSLPIRGPYFVHSPPPKGEGEIVFDGPSSDFAIMDDDEW